MFGTDTLINHCVNRLGSRLFLTLIPDNPDNNLSEYFLYKVKVSAIREVRRRSDIDITPTRQPVPWEPSRCGGQMRSRGRSANYSVFTQS